MYRYGINMSIGRTSCSAMRPPLGPPGDLGLPLGLVLPGVPELDPYRHPRHDLPEYGRKAILWEVYNPLPPAVVAPPADTRPLARVPALSAHFEF